MPCRALIYSQFLRRKSVFFNAVSYCLLAYIVRMPHCRCHVWIPPNTLGTVIDSKLNFDKNCAERIKDAPETSLSERILLYFHKTSKISFYWAFTALILSLSLVSGFGSLSVKNRNSLHHVVKWSSKLMGESQLNPTCLCTRLLQWIAASI